MNCKFCGKININHGHNCKEKKDIYDRYSKLLEYHKQEIIQIHTDKEKGLSSSDIFNEYIKERLFEEFNEKEIDAIIDSFNQSSTGGTPTEKIRTFLKENKVFIKSTPSRMNNIQKSLQKKYGIINPGQLEKNKKSLSERNNNKVFKIPENILFEEYNNKVQLLTRKNRKKLEKPLYDYYTNLPFLKELCDSNLMQGDLYPTIDHKKSVIYCFYNSISAEECANPSNLCWTFRYLNTKKNCLTENEFKTSILFEKYKKNLSISIEKLISNGYHKCN